jgi:hypothetical protein
MDQLRDMAPSAFATEPHSSRSARFAYIPTSGIIEAMMKEGFQPFKATQSGSRIEGKAEFTKHMIRFRHISNTAELLKVGDKIPEVVLVNAHDGTSTYQLMSGIFVLLCSNGLMVADGTIESLKVQHTGNIVDKVIEGSFQIVKQAPKALETVKVWETLKLTAGEQNAYAEAAHTIRFADSEGNVETPITPAMLLTPKRYGDAGNSLWETFNRVQEHVIKGGDRARAARKPGEHRGRMVSTREVKGIDGDIKMNKALWRLAERMAELKGIGQAA